MNTLDLLYKIRNQCDGVDARFDAIKAIIDEYESQRSEPRGQQQWTPLFLAQHFHNIYERCASEFGYETRAETRSFNPETANGKLMIAVCSEILRDFDAALVNERQQLEEWERAHKAVSEMVDGAIRRRLEAEQQLLSSLAAIEKHNEKFYGNSEARVEFNPSALHEHDAKVHTRAKNEGWYEGREHERKCQAAVTAEVREHYSSLYDAQEKRHAEVREPLVEALNVLLDSVDYIAHNCSANEMVGVVLPCGIIRKCRDALAKVKEDK